MEDIPRQHQGHRLAAVGPGWARQWWKLLLVAGAALLSSASFTAIPLAVGMGIDRLVDAIRAFDGSAGVVETARRRPWGCPCCWWPPRRCSAA